MHGRRFTAAIFACNAKPPAQRPEGHHPKRPTAIADAMARLGGVRRGNRLHCGDCPSPVAARSKVGRPRTGNRNVVRSCSFLGHPCARPATRLSTGAPLARALHTMRIQPARQSLRSLSGMWADHRNGPRLASRMTLTHFQAGLACAGLLPEAVRIDPPQGAWAAEDRPTRSGRGSRH